MFLSEAPGRLQECVCTHTLVHTLPEGWITLYAPVKATSLILRLLHNRITVLGKHFFGKRVTWFVRKGLRDNHTDCLQQRTQSVWRRCSLHQLSPKLTTCQAVLPGPAAVSWLLHNPADCPLHPPCCRCPSTHFCPFAHDPSPAALLHILLNVHSHYCCCRGNTHHALPAVHPNDHLCRFSSWFAAASRDLPRKCKDKMLSNVTDSFIKHFYVYS